LDEVACTDSLSGRGLHDVFFVGHVPGDPAWFREFRVLQTGPSSSGFLSFGLAGFEIHGDVRRELSPDESPLKPGQADPAPDDRAPPEGAALLQQGNSQTQIESPVHSSGGEGGACPVSTVPVSTGSPQPTAAFSTLDRRFQGIIHRIWRSSGLAHNDAEIEFIYASLTNASDCHPTHVYDYTAPTRYGTGPSAPRQYFGVRFLRMAVHPCAYALRSAFTVTGSNHLRSWAFQGRENESSQWITLDERKCVTYLTGPGFHAWFAVAKVAGDRAWYREFRVLQTGPSNSRFLSFNLSGFEIHGTVQHDSDLRSGDETRAMEALCAD
jgi:hypothetical protein